MSENKTIKSFNPATLKEIGEVEITPVEEMPHIIARAREAQKSWGELPFKIRAERMLRVSDHILKNMDSIARVINAEMGKHLVEALFSDIFPTLEMIHFFAAQGEKMLDDEMLKSPLLMFQHRKGYIRFEPRGLAAVVSPWNFPFAIPLSGVIPALLTGNACILKPASITALIGEEIRKSVQAAELPEGLFTVVQGGGSTVGNALITGQVDTVVFTGSVPVGKKVAAAAGSELRKLVLELGGKDPTIVLEDADLERASSGVVWGAFINAGQVCASVERVYVVEKVAAEFIERVEEKTRKLRVGLGTDFNVDMGPMVSEDQRNIVRDHLQDALALGAKVTAEGRLTTDLPGYFQLPTVLVNADHSMKVMTLETFGPVLPVMVVRDEQEAVKMANDSPYGLTASVWTGDLKRGQSVASRLQAGTVNINDCVFSYGVSAFPWSGVKESGMGVTHSKYGLLDFVNLKAVSVVAADMWKDPWWYPYSREMYDAVISGSRVLYGQEPLERIKALPEFIMKFYQGMKNIGESNG